MVESVRDRVVRRSDESQKNWSVKIFRRARLCRETNPFRELFRLLVRNGRRMEYYDTAAACLVVVELLVALGSPVDFSALLRLGGKKTRSDFFLLQLCGIACVFNGFNELIGCDSALLDFDVRFVRQGYIRINYSFDL